MYTEKIDPYQYETLDDAKRIADNLNRSIYEIKIIKVTPKAHLQGTVIILNEEQQEYIANSRRTGKAPFKIVGNLRKTNRKVKPIRVGTRQIMIDDVGQQWVKVFGKYWKFPEEIEY